MTDRAENTKKRILTAAEQEFSEKGLYGARVDEIAARAEVNKRMLYAYFGDKEQLYIAVLEAVYARIAEPEAPAQWEKERRAEDRIRVLIHRYFTFLYQNPSFVRIVMWENLNEARFLRTSRAAGIRGGSLALLRKTLQTGVENGDFCPDTDVEATLLSINQLCFSYFSNIHTFTEILQQDLSAREAMDRRAEHTAQLILSYLKSRCHFESK